MSDDECPECSNMSPCCSWPDGDIINEMHWQAFADSWLAIGLAAAYVEAEALRWCNLKNSMSENETRDLLAGHVGRVVRRRK